MFTVDHSVVVYSVVNCCIILLLLSLLSFCIHQTKNDTIKSRIKVAQTVEEMIMNSLL